MQQPTYLTAEGRQQAEEELAQLINVERPRVIDAISAAREHGDISDNADYETARHKQAFIEGRISELQHLLNTAVLIESKASKTAAIGSTVTVREDDGSEYALRIVGPAEASPRDGRISYASPIGQALLGKKAREKAVVNAPGGAYSIVVVSVA